MNRRKFVSSAALGIAAVSSLSLTGCDPVAAAENWIPIALSAVAAITSLLGPVIPPQVGAIILLITQGLNALLTALKNYMKGSGVIQDIQNAAAAVELAFSNFFDTLNVPPMLLATIEGLANILLSTLAALINKIHPATVTYRLKGKLITVTPIMRNNKQFIATWNAFAVANGVPRAEI